MNSSSNGKMTITGLTAKQKEMLDTMWSIDTWEQLQEWRRKLSPAEYQMSSVLIEVVRQEAAEQILRQRHPELFPGEAN